MNASIDPWTQVLREVPGLVGPYDGSLMYKQISNKGHLKGPGRSLFMASFDANLMMCL